MNNRRFQRREPRSKSILCSCGQQAKLIKRRNFPHGRKSGGVSYQLYVCRNCNKQNMLNMSSPARR